jgi:hypothetical protein
MRRTATLSGIGVAISLLCTATFSHAAERRCGWYMNPTPGNLLLADRDGAWWITSQMQAQGPDAEGADDKAPDFDTQQYVETQPNGYGYGCACLTVETNTKEMRITRVISGEILPLSQCKSDSGLPPPPEL